jgi:membrane fusion protein (multidrug efflux system)
MLGKKIIATTLIVALAAAMVSGCGTGEASVASQTEIEAATPVPVEVALPERSDIFATYEVTSTIASDADAPVVARVGGEVIELVVEEGDRVVAGQILARLDGERLRLEMLSAKANMERIRGEYERYTDLAARGLVSEAMFEDLSFDLEELEASYDLARLNYEYSMIRAPIDGLVSARDIKLGQSIEVNAVVFRITDTKELLAHLQIPQAELGKFAAGHSATFIVDSMPDSQYAAMITRISPTIDTRNGTFRATAYIDNVSGEIAPGMFARFTIAYEKHSDALVIPERALVEEDNQTAVYIVENGQVSRRIIETGIEADGLVEVLDGLTADEQVVVVGQSGLRDGSRVAASNKRLDSYTG